MRTLAKVIFGKSSLVHVAIVHPGAHRPCTCIWGRTL